MYQQNFKGGIGGEVVFMIDEKKIQAKFVVDTSLKTFHLYFLCEKEFDPLTVEKGLYIVADVLAQATMTKEKLTSQKQALWI